MKPLVVVFSLAYEPFIGGAEVFVREVSQRLAGSWQFTIITGRFQRSLPLTAQDGPTMVYRVGLGHPRIDKWLYPLFALHRGWRLGRRPAVVHGIMASYGGLAASLFARLTRRPCLITEQSGNLHTDVQRHWLTFRLYQWIYRQATVIHAISRFIERSIRQSVPSAPAVTVIPNGIDETAFRDRPRRSADPNAIVCVARLSWEKGVSDVIEAMPLVLKAWPTARLMIIGEGPERPALERLIAERRLSGSVRLAGSVAHPVIPERLAQASLFVCASHFEGLGIVFLEAQACGLPVVGTDVGGIPDIVIHEETGLLVPPRAPAALAQAILRLKQDPALADRLRQNARQRLPRFRWSRIAGEIGQLYLRCSDRLQRPLSVVLATGIFPPDAGGPATYTARLTAELRRQGLNVSVVTYADAPGRPARAADRIVRVSRRWPLPFRYAFFMLQVLRLARSAQGVFSQDAVSAGLPALIAAWLTRKPLIVKIVGDAAWEYAQNAGRTTDDIDTFQQRPYTDLIGWLRRVQRFVCQRSRGVIVPSHYLRSLVVGWGVPRERITCLPNATDLAVDGDPASTKAALKAALGRAEDFLLVSVGRLVPWKGFLELVGLMPGLIRQEPRAHLMIIGDGPLASRLTDAVARLGLTTRVELPGRRPPAEVFHYLRAADCFVLNSGYEGLSHVLLEAFAAGTPVVTTTAGGNPEVIQDGHQGLLVPPGDPAALTQAILRIRRQPAEARGLVAAARRRLTAFSWRELGPTIASYLKQVFA